MKNKVKIIMLQTAYKTNIKYNSSLKLFSSEISNYGVDKNDYISSQHLYITVSQDVELIKEGDLYFNVEEKGGMKNPFYGKVYKANKSIHTVSPEWTHNLRKIIATTDNLSTQCECKHGSSCDNKCFIPDPSQSFLKEFLANPDGEFEVEYEPVYLSILKEKILGYKLKLNQDNTVNITSVEEKERGITITNAEKKMYSKEEIEHILIKFLKADKAWKDPKKWIKENL
jgi:hypothetical protein